MQNNHFLAVVLKILGHYLTYFWGPGSAEGFFFLVGFRVRV